MAEKASRRCRLYSIRGSDSPVTGAAIRVNVAGGVRDRLSPVRRARRRLAPARKPRRRDPRAPAAARRAQPRQAQAAASPDRPRLLGRRLAGSQMVLSAYAIYRDRDAAQAADRLERGRRWGHAGDLMSVTPSTSNAPNARSLQSRSIALPFGVSLRRAVGERT
jgi:hypothetical protein